MRTGIRDPGLVFVSWSEQVEDLAMPRAEAQDLGVPGAIWYGQVVQVDAFDTRGEPAHGGTAHLVGHRLSAGGM
jgi:hypothetical protein